MKSAILRSRRSQCRDRPDADGGDHSRRVRFGCPVDAQFPGLGALGARLQGDRRAAPRAVHASARTAAFAAMVDAARDKGFSDKLAFVNTSINRADRLQARTAPFTASSTTGQNLRKSSSGGAGDCEDFAILKMAALLHAGIPAQSMSLVVLQDRKEEFLSCRAVGEHRPAAPSSSTVLAMPSGATAICRATCRSIPSAPTAHGSMAPETGRRQDGRHQGWFHDDRARRRPAAGHGSCGHDFGPPRPAVSGALSWNCFNRRRRTPSAVPARPPAPAPHSADPGSGARRRR